MATTAASTTITSTITEYSQESLWNTAKELLHQINCLVGSSNNNDNNDDDDDITELTVSLVTQLTQLYDKLCNVLLSSLSSNSNDDTTTTVQWKRMTIIQIQHQVQLCNALEWTCLQILTYIHRYSQVLIPQSSPQEVWNPTSIACHRKQTQRTILRTYRQCQWLIEKLLLSLKLKRQQEDKQGLHATVTTSTNPTTTDTEATSNHSAISLFFDPHIQALLHKHTILAGIVLVHDENILRLDEKNDNNNPVNHDDDDDKTTTNLLMGLSRQELANEEQLLIKMASTPLSFHHPNNNYTTTERESQRKYKTMPEDDDP